MPGYGLRDRGDQFVDFVSSAFGPDHGDAVRRSIAPTRLPNGVIDARLLDTGKRDGPARLLGSWLGTARIGFEVWAEPAFGRFERRRLIGQATAVLDNEGPDAAVDWVLGNATKRAPSVSVLQADWDDMVFTGPLDAEYYRGQVYDALRAWRR
ncbi:hypothetical protein [Curtobacterium pusillum]|uniref:hypothetical protein n=1 Tax=Curtobacterium pusillum TaxID=69373 RepID=UPI0011A643C7|nr:hypothetical protein [Curtobacterium pusillum]